jgi:hypothetical protein
MKYIKPIILITCLFLAIGCGSHPLETTMPLQSTATGAVSNLCIPILNRGLPVDESIVNSHILYSSWSSKTEQNNQEKIWAFSVKDGSIHLILDHSPFVPLGLVYLKDGYRFIIIGDSSIWLSDMNGSLPREFKSTDQFISEFPLYTPTWNLLAQINKIPGASDKDNGLLNSPAGIYTAMWRVGDSALIIKNRFTGDETRVIETDKLDAIYGNWSPNGSQFVFSYYRNGDGHGNGYYSQVFGVNFDGTGLHPLSIKFEDSLLTSPRWSKDGSKIMFTYNVGLNKYLLVLNLQSGEDVSIKISPFWRITTMDEGDFIWSPDGKWILYISAYGYYGIEAVNTENGKIYCITENDQYTTIDALDWR